MQNSKLEPKIKRQYSAGGVVYKRSKAQDEKRKTLWLIGKHSGYHKWVLPKGLIEKGERGWQTAIREAEEEMGVKTHLFLKKPIKKIEYFYFADPEKDQEMRDSKSFEKLGQKSEKKVRIFKTVSFYLLEYQSGDCQKHDWEMEEVGWFSFKQAFEKLAFKGEREALEKAKKILEKEEKQLRFL